MDILVILLEISNKPSVTKIMYWTIVGLLLGLLAYFVWLGSENKVQNGKMVKFKMTCIALTFLGIFIPFLHFGFKFGLIKFV